MKEKGFCLYLLKLSGLILGSERILFHIGIFKKRDRLGVYAYICML